MSTATYTSHHQTRQELDELDALLQRMLSLPMGSMEPEASASSQKSKPLPAILSLEQFAPLPPTMTPSPSLIGSTMGEDSVVYAWRAELPAAFGPPVEEPPMAILVELPESAIVPEPRFYIPPANPLPQAYSPPSMMPPYPYSVEFGPAVANPLPPGPFPLAPTAPVTQPIVTSIPSPQWQSPPRPLREPLPFILWPVYLLNKIFDLLSFLLGPLGTWLRQPSGRNVLGWLGILMLLGAIGWGAADWYGMDWIR